MKTRISIFLILSTGILFGQNGLEVFYPANEFLTDLSMKAEKEIKRQKKLLEKESLTNSEQIELDSLLEIYGEVVESVWDVIESGCSWYCGGGNYKVVASSYLDSHKGINYQAKSANDLSYQTAWVEGEVDEGIGEYLEFHFKNESPRITSIIISNGYVKNGTVWENNNRIKSFKLYVNGEEFGIMRLSDNKSDQEFKIGTFGSNEDGTDLILRFEILEIYKGKKYNDTAITEIYFDGIDVH